jgi:hypothetical protein
MMVKKGDSAVNDFIRSSLERHHPAIHIEDTPWIGNNPCELEL